ncbi:hypothetical protein SLNWT_7300 [Streptomyces albus]|uniref:Uncharacterized protein n=1 Tax=Streptomyces albus (strain ATCC 21838 / DSM 41398 / FERM P-419 / JCM 4703 / NBRC 107858) TaxID=1081613 RepID=A0A0B5F9Z0_STRA4|nr:hypothetical protein SLNWT_7300 [Streptomyces albus]
MHCMASRKCAPHRAGSVDCAPRAGTWVWGSVATDERTSWSRPLFLSRVRAGVGPPRRGLSPAPGGRMRGIAAGHRRGGPPAAQRRISRGPRP